MGQQEKPAGGRMLQSDETPVETLKVSVRDLVFFVLRSGDLFERHFGGSAALEGIRGHQRVQRSRPPGYEAEVAVRHVHHYGAFDLEISGRIDGVFTNTEPVMVEEIKTTRLPFDEIPENARTLHLGQARLYAYLYALAHDLPRLAVQLTYYNLDSGLTSSSSDQYDFPALATFFNTLADAWMNWATKVFNWRRERDAAIAGGAFPHDNWRAGQRQLAVAAYRALRDGGRLFAQAPTGTGKTIGVLFPALKALGEGRCERLFYLAARTSGKQVAQDALQLMRAKGLRCKSLTITAKDKVCFDAPCNPETCPYTKGYYDRIAAALAEGFEAPVCDRETLLAIAQRHTVCPFELTLELATWTDVIVCDYNYVFDPGVQLRGFFGEDAKSPTVLLVDEAHNLVDRARDMFSASLSKREMLEVRRLVRADAPELARPLATLNRLLLDWLKDLAAAGEEERVGDRVPERLPHLLHRFCNAFEEWLARVRPAALAPILREFYFAVRRFLRTAELFDNSYRSILRSAGRPGRGRPDLEVKLYNLDPAGLLARTLDRSQAAIFFSATLSPPHYFLRLLGGVEGSELLRLPSPFPPQRLCTLVAPYIDTRYKRRADGLPALVATLAAMVGARRGNYLIYFPSYKYLMATHDRFVQDHSHLMTMVQEPGMSEQQRETFLAAFSQDRDETLVGFAVMAGAFGEGIDLVGERLIGVAVVGVGLPQICLERDLIRAHFESLGDGFAFAYQYPGMNRVLQTSGRVIRSERDCGVVCLIDERFSHERYRRLFPSHWRPAFATGVADLEVRLHTFWQGIDTQIKAAISTEPKPEKPSGIHMAQKPGPESRGE